MGLSYLVVRGVAPSRKPLRFCFATSRYFLGLSTSTCGFHFQLELSVISDVACSGELCCIHYIHRVAVLLYTDVFGI